MLWHVQYLHVSDLFKGKEREDGDDLKQRRGNQDKEKIVFV